MSTGQPPGDAQPQPQGIPPQGPSPQYDPQGSPIHPAGGEGVPAGAPSQGLPPQNWRPEGPPTATPQQPRRRGAALPWIIVGVLAVLLAAAGVAFWLFTSQSADRDRAVAEHARAATAYEEAWDSLQVSLDEGELALADAENGSVADSELLASARNHLDAAAAIEPRDLADPRELSGVAEIDADRDQIIAATNELADAKALIVADIAELDSAVLGEVRTGLTEAVSAARAVADDAWNRDEATLAEGLTATADEAEALLDDPAATAAQLREAWERLIAETDAVSAALVPRADGINGTWCADGDCQTVALPTLSSVYGDSTLVETGMTSSGCFEFVASSAGEVGGFAVVYCPAGVPAGDLAGSDLPGVDRMFQGQGTPMLMYLRD